MKYSHLAVVVTSLLGSLGEPDPADYTDYQEDCAGKALLSAGLSVFRLKGNYRDVPRINVGELSVAQGQVQQSLRPALQLGLSSYVAGSPLAPKFTKRLWSAELRTVRQNGLWWIAPPCNTWVWISRSTTGRRRTLPKGSFAGCCLLPAEGERITRKPDGPTGSFEEFVTCLLAGSLS